MPYTSCLVVIARDEAARITRLLDSARPWVDRLLVLDTGSCDGTQALAKAAGAQLEEATWRDDFAWARNQALSLAAADWHVVLDADEWLVDGGAALAALRHTAPSFVGALRVDSAFDQGGATLSAPSWISRVLPGDLRFTGRIHEQVQHQLPVRRLPVTIAHDGYRADALARKAGRNTALLARCLQDAPQDPYAWYQWGKDHDVYQRHHEAMQGFDTALQHLGGNTATPTWLHDLTVRKLHAHKRLGQYALGLQWAQDNLDRWAQSPDLFFALGDLLLDWAAEQPELGSTLLPMIEEAWQTCLRLGEHPELEGAVQGRGSHLAASNLALLYDLLERPAPAQAMREMAQRSVAQAPAAAG
jgi:glycosyltransferase involved in cell wall biosynthesis